MQPFVQDMGYDGEPFIWNPNRRALLRAELNAYYAKLYGLIRDELRIVRSSALAHFHRNYKSYHVRLNNRHCDRSLKAFSQSREAIPKTL